MSAVPTVDDIVALEAAGVDQVVVRPWVKGRDAVPNLRAFADDIGLT